MPAYHQANFSGLNRTGKFKLRVTSSGRDFYSNVFQIKSNALAELTIPSILHYYRRQRANTPSEMAVDSRMKLYGSEQEVDMRGGWCDASGDVSKYFSHLAYANFMSPQQIPLVTWSLINTRERIPRILKRLSVKDSVEQEALWGADYLMRALSKEGYFT